MIMNINDLDNFTQPIIKFDFYQNGDIKEIYIPNDLEETLFNKLYSLLTNFLPSLKVDDYCNNITEELNKINNEAENDDEEEIEITNENEENENKENENENEETDLKLDVNRRIRRLNRKVKKVTKYKIISIEKNNQNVTRILNSNNESNENTEFIKEIEFVDSSESKNYSDINLREFSSNGEKNDASTTINQYKEGLVGDEEQKLKNSSKIIHTNIIIDDNLGIIKYIIMNSTIKLNDNSNDDEDKDDSNENNNKGNQINEKSLNSLEDEINYGENPTNNNYSSSINSSFSYMLYISNDTIFNKDNFLNINKELVNKLKESFEKYNYKLYNETIYGNKTMRILKDLSNYIDTKNNDDTTIIVEEIPLDEYLRNKKDKKLRKLSNNYDDTYYGLKNIDISQKTYETNLLGLNIEGNIQNTIDQSKGTINSFTNLIFGKKKLTYRVKETQTNIHIITKNLNEMIKHFVIILKELEENEVKRGKNYSEIIVNLEKNIGDMINKTNIYDFGKIFQSPLNNMYDEVKNFSSGLFNDFISLIDESYSNYTSIVNDMKEDRFEIFKEIREITKKKYIEYIYSSLNQLDTFSNNTMNYLNNLEELIKDILNFQIDVLYDIVDNIEEAKNIFKNFCFLLFDSITKGIKTFKNDLNNYLDEMIGELLYITEFISFGLENNDILRNSLDSETRNITIDKLKNFKIIINTIINYLIEGIFYDYNNEMLSSNPQSIKYYTEKKTSELFKEFDKNSSDLITSIKLKIKYIEKYELYSFNIDQINTMNYNLEKKFNENSNEKIIKYIINVKPDFLNKSSELIKQKNNLFNITVNIKNEINKGINEINDYINSYSNKYKDENIFNLLLNLYNFRKSFTDETMNTLLNEFITLINNTVNKEIKRIIKYNYDLGFEYFNEERLYFHKYRDKWRKMITTGFMNKYSRFVEEFKKYLTLFSSSDFIEIFETNYYNLKTKIINYIKNKLLLINQYYFNNEQFSGNFYFISQIINEITEKTNIIHNYFTETIFNGKIQTLILNGIDTISSFDEDLSSKFKESYNNIYEMGKRIKNDERDFCWAQFRLFYWKYHYSYTEHTNNIYLVINNLKPIEKYVISYTNQIYDKFILKFNKYLDSCVKISNNLYNHLYSFTENKINDNQNLNELLSEYQNVFYNIVNDSNKDLINFNNNEDINNSVEIILKEMTNQLENIKNEYYNYYYLNNQTDFLEYPYEIIFKCNQIINELNENSNYIKLTINSLYKEKIKNIIKETNYFIKEINNNNYLYITSHLNYSYNIMNYIEKKTEILKSSFNNYETYMNLSLQEKSNYFNNNNINILNDLNYDSKFRIIIKNTKAFINEFNQTIFDNFTQIICKNNTEELIYEEEETEKSENNTEELVDEEEEKEKSENNTEELVDEEEEKENIINETNYTNITCKIIYFESELDYSKYNFQIVKIRNAIYYTKNLYEELNEIYKNELNNDNDLDNKIINKEYLKEKDDKINEKNIWLIYNESLNLLKDYNKESKEILMNYYENFKEDLLEICSLNNDKNRNIFKEYIQILNKILNNNYQNFTNKINNDLNTIHSFLLNNQILNKEYDEINEYFYSTIDEIKLNQTFMSYYNSLDNIFKNYMTIINNDLNDYHFYNAFSYSIKNLYYSQFIKYGKSVEEYSKNFNFELLNITLDLDKYIIEILKDDYNDFEFLFLFDYIESYDKYQDFYKKNLNNNLTNLRDKALSIFKLNYDDYLKKLKNSKNYVSKDFIEELNDNYSNCLNYSKFTLDEIILEDQMNWEKYENYTKLLELHLNSTNNTNSSLDLEETDTINIKDLEEITYFNETEYWLYCDNNNFFNYSNIIVKDIDSTNKQLMNDTLNKINDELNNNKFDGNYLYNFLYNEFSTNIIKNNIFSNEDLDNLYYNFENFQDISEYLSLKINKKYINSLKHLFIKYFNISYSNFVNNYLVNDINITSHVIFEKINSKLNYIKTKIIEENNYYIYLLNNTKEIGITSKETLLNLYPLLFLKINDSFHELLEKGINEEIGNFFIKNKKIFFDNFIDFINQNKNNHFIEIHKLNDYFTDIIKDREFNKTLESISSNLLYDNIINQIKKTSYNILNQKMTDLKNLLFNLENQIKEELNKIIVLNYSDDMIPILNENNKYLELVNEQNKKFNFIIDNEPFIILDNFTSFYLESPLFQIKQYYNKIEDELLTKLFYLIDNFDDIYGVIKNKFEKFYNIEKIKMDFNLTKQLIDQYIKLFSNEILDIKNRLFHYTYINGLDPNYKTNRNLNKIENENKLNIISQINNEYNQFNKSEGNNKDKKSNSYFNFKRNLNSKEGSYQFSHIIKAFRFVKQIFSSFSDSYLSSDFNQIFTNLNYFLLKNEQFLTNLQRTIDFSLLKFSNILTPEKLYQLEKKIYYQYTLIEPFVQNYIKTFSENIIKFTDYLNSKISYYETAFLQFNMTITSIYNELSNNINNKFQIVSKRKTSEIIIALSNSLQHTLIEKKFFQKQLTESLEISIGLEISVNIGLDVGIEIKDKTIFIDTYGETSLTISGEIYFFLGQKPTKIKVGAGISIVLASVKRGCKYKYEIMEKNHILEIYLEAKAFELNAYLFLEIELKIGDFKLSYRVELAAQLYNGISASNGIRKKIPIQGKSETSLYFNCEIGKKKCLY